MSGCPALDGTVPGRQGRMLFVCLVRTENMVFDRSKVVVESQTREYGDDVSSTPCLTPFT